MSSLLDRILPCPEPAVQRELPHCDLLTDEQCAAVDDTADLIGCDPIVAGLTPLQRMWRAAQLDAMRAGQLRRIPTAFAPLDD